MTANRIISHIFQQPDLQHVDQAELERLVAQYPYFAAARLLLAQKKYAADHNLADESLKNAQLYSGTTHHLHQFLQGEQAQAPAYTKYVTPPEVVAEQERLPEAFAEKEVAAVESFTETPVVTEQEVVVTSPAAETFSETPVPEVVAEQERLPEAFAESFTETPVPEVVAEQERVAPPAAETFSETPVPEVVAEQERLPEAFAETSVPEIVTSHQAENTPEEAIAQTDNTPEETDFKAQFWKEQGVQPATEETDFKAQFWKEQGVQQPAEETDFKAQFWKEQGVQQPAAEETQEPAADPKAQFWQEYYGKQYTPDTAAESTAPAEEQAAVAAEDQSEHYLNEYYGAAEAAVTEEAAGQIEGALIDHAPSSFHITEDNGPEYPADEIGTFILTADPDPFESSNIRSIADIDTAVQNDIYNTVIDEPGETIASSSTIEEDTENEAAEQYEQMVQSTAPLSPAAAALATDVAEEQLYNTTHNDIEHGSNLETSLEEQAAENSFHIPGATQQVASLTEAEENALATVNAAEAIYEEQETVLTEAEINALATVDAAEAIHEEQETILSEAAINALATVDAAEAIYEEQETILSEAEVNALATVDAAEAIREEQETILSEAEVNALATVDAAEAINEEQDTVLSEAQVNNAATAATATEEEAGSPMAGFYNTTIDQPGETIEDTSNAAAELEETTAEQFSTLTDAEEHAVTQELPPAEFYNTTLDQPGETIEDTSNAAAELEEVTAEQFSTLTDAGENYGIPLADHLVPVFDAPLATAPENTVTEATTPEEAPTEENTEDGPIKIFPLEMPADEETTLVFQPLYTEDYFAYKRLKDPVKADVISEKGEAEMKSFTDWLRQMKEGFAGKSQREWYHQQIHRLYEDEEPEVSEAVEKMAIESITFNDDIISETLAEVWVRQHQYQKAISIYQKLSLLNPGKSAYFAQKIKDLQSQTDNN